MKKTEKLKVKKVKPLDPKVWCGNPVQKTLADER